MFLSESRAGGGVMLTPKLHPQPRKRMSGAIRLQPLYAFMECAGTTVYSSLHRCTLVQIFSSAICYTKPPIQVISSKYHIYFVQGLTHAPLLHRACGLMPLEQKHKECSVQVAGCGSPFSCNLTEITIKIRVRTLGVWPRFEPGNFYIPSEALVL